MLSLVSEFTFPLTLRSVPDTGYRARIRGVKRQRSAPQPEITSAQEAAQVDAEETGTRRSRRTKSVVNYYIPPPPDMEET